MSETKKRNVHLPEFKAKVGAGGGARGDDDQRDRSGARRASGAGEPVEKGNPGAGQDLV